MKILDIVILSILIYGFVEGFNKGFLVMVINTIALFLGVVCGFYFLEQGIDFLQKIWVGSPKILPIVSFFLIYALVNIGVYLLGLLLKKAIQATLFVGQLDKIAGGLVGVVQWLFTLSILIWILDHSHTFRIPASYTEGSLFYSKVEHFAEYVIEQSQNILPFTKDLLDEISKLL
jgi:membrane protein required for colicin V production